MAIFFGRGKLQTQLKVGSPNDKFEKEADQIVSKSTSPDVQQAPTPPIQTQRVTSSDLQTKEVEPMVQKEEAPSESEEIQLKQTEQALQKKEANSDFLSSSETES